MSTIYRTCIVSLLFIFCSNRQSVAQSQKLRFEQIGVEEGLSNEMVTTILQSRDSFLWVGTFDGLYKYDGYSFIKYQLDPFDPSTLSQYTTIMHKRWCRFPSSIFKNINLFLI